MQTLWLSESRQQIKFFLQKDPNSHQVPPTLVFKHIYNAYIYYGSIQPSQKNIAALYLSTDDKHHDIVIV